MVVRQNFPVPVPEGSREVGKRNWELGFEVNPSAGLAPALLQLMAIKQTSINLISF